MNIPNETPPADEDLATSLKRLVRTVSHVGESRGTHVSHASRRAVMSGGGAVGGSSRGMAYVGLVAS